jgi:hypothetical protein
MTPAAKRARALLLVLASAGAASCTCPPCAAAPTTAAATCPPPAAAVAVAPTVPTAAAGTQRKVIWDGDAVTRGQGWANCDQQAQGCKSTLAPAPGEGSAGTSGLKLHGEGPGWQGGGWNWFGWWPENAGTDLSGYDELIFSVRVTGADKAKLPTVGGISLALGCSLQKKSSADAPLAKYAADAADGQWHEVKIPLRDFFSGPGAACDPRTAWELRVSSWSGTPVDFDLVLDNITVARR